MTTAPATLRLSPVRRRALIDALRRGTVPEASLGFLAVGLERFAPVLDEELGVLRAGGAGFKAIRGEYGSGKTFFLRWLQERARAAGFATAEVQISETETPLHRVETVYRRAMERLATEDTSTAALTAVVERWFYTLEADVTAQGIADSEPGFEPAVVTLMEQRLAEISREAPQFSAVLRALRAARASGDAATAQGLMAWLSGQPNVGAPVKRAAGIKGEIDHFGALSFLRGLLTLLREAGHPGLVLVLDEVETLQRVRSDVREKSLNALRGLLDDLDAGR